MILAETKFHTRGSLARVIKLRLLQDLILLFFSPSVYAVLKPQKGITV